MKLWFISLLCIITTTIFSQNVAVRNGNWSSNNTWSLDRVPVQDEQVIIDKNVKVIYDVNNLFPIKTLQVKGKLIWKTDADTRLKVGMIVVDTLNNPNFNADCSRHSHTMIMDLKQRPVMQIGSWDNPITASAIVELVHYPEFNSNCSPGIIVYSGLFEVHGKKLNRTWINLSNNVNKGSNTLTIDEAIDWKIGDAIIVTGANLQEPPHDQNSRRHTGKIYTELKRITAINGKNLTVNSAFAEDHHNASSSFTLPDGQVLNRNVKHKVANLTRNVIIRTAVESSSMGHTMYHHGSAGSLSYASFDSLGKRDLLARYPIHWHKASQSFRNDFLIGVVVTKSDNRTITIHGTDKLYVRDFIGYRALGNSVYLEDSSEMGNILFRNLSAHSFDWIQIPNQAVPDGNDGAGFSFYNPYNAFIENAAVENDRYGFYYGAKSNLHTQIVDENGNIIAGYPVYTLPSLRFEDNESIGTLEYGFWADKDAMPKADDPFVTKNFTSYLTWRAFSNEGNNFWIENFYAKQVAYAWYGRLSGNVYLKNAIMDIAPASGMVISASGPSFGLRPAIQIVENIALSGFKGTANEFAMENKRPHTDPVEGYIINYKFFNKGTKTKFANSSAGALSSPTSLMVFKDHFPNGDDLLIIPHTQTRNDGLNYQLGDDNLVAVDMKYAAGEKSVPKNPITLTDNRKPISSIRYPKNGQELRNISSIDIFGTAIDQYGISKVIVNGKEATSKIRNFLEWTVNVPVINGVNTIECYAVDVNGFTETDKHSIILFVNNDNNTPTKPDSPTNLRIRKRPRGN